MDARAAVHVEFGSGFEDEVVDADALIVVVEAGSTLKCLQLLNSMFSKRARPRTMA